MNPTVPLLLTVTAVLVAAALPGCGEKEEPALADAGGPSGGTPSTRECEGRTQEHAFDRARLVNGGRVLRVAYTESSSYPPCELRVRYLRGSLRVTPRVAYPRAGFDDLRYWCAEGRLPAAVRARELLDRSHQADEALADAVAAVHAVDSHRVEEVAAVLDLSLEARHGAGH